MKSIQRYQIYILIIVVISIGSTCTRQLIPEIRIEHEDRRQPLLIIAVVRSSEFKKEILQQLVERYQKHCSIEVLNITTHEQVVEKEYDVLLVVDERRPWMLMNGKLKSLIRKADKEKLVVFLTAGQKNWEYAYHGVESITSASKSEKAEGIVSEVVERINMILQER